MTRDIYEWRINKKGCEVFRTRSRKELNAKLDQLHADHPNTQFTIQTRLCRMNKAGVPLLMPNGEPMWTSWS